MKKIALFCGVPVLAAGIAAAALIWPPISASAGAAQSQAFDTATPAPVPVASAEPLPESLAFPELVDLDAEEETGAEAAVPKYTFDNYIFLGDSLIYGPKDVIVSHGHQVLAGVGASIQNLANISTASRTLGAQDMAGMTGTLRDRDFNGIVILMGANDVVGDFGTAEAAMEKYRAVLEELRGASDVPIFVLKVFPTGPSYMYWDRSVVGERTEALNGMLSDYCDGVDGLYFIDATGAFTDENGDLIHDLGDGLHIGPDYYELFYEGIEGALYGTGLFAAPADLS